SFFQGFCWETNTLAENTPVEFVRLLHEKWFERHPRTEPAVLAGTTQEPAKPASHSIFISYAHQDFEAAGRVRDTLDQLGLNVWMDKKGLEAGDLYRAKITHHIWHCTLFIPLLSKNAEWRKEAFFREEWDDALRRVRRFKGSSRAFIVPVVVDDLDLYAARNIPDEFKEIHVTLAQQGVLSNDAALRIQQITRSIIKTEGSAV